MVTDQDSLISVIMANFNGERYLAEAIESVLCQSYRNFELIIVDDGSTDNSWVILERYLAENAGCVKLIRQLNAGAACARNRGIREASGEFISFLDSDDYWHPKKLESQVKVLKRNPEAVACFCSFRVWQPVNGSYPPAEKETEDSVQYTEVDSELTGYIYSQLLRDAHVSTITFLGYREIVDSFGGFDERFPVGEDIGLWLKIAARYKFVKCKYPFALYRTVQTSLTHKIYDKNYELIVFENAENNFGLTAPDGSGMTIFEAKARKAWLSFSYGYQCFWCGRPELAITAFKQSLGYQFSFKTMLYWTFSHQNLYRLASLKRTVM